jgi:phosphopantothenoylcysteine decarboxylase/phosphopantothenate--cysteine ligase
VLLAPAMNVVMWQHPATRRNLRQLETDGCLVVGPDSGPMACGEHGPGRMVEPESLLEHIVAIFQQSAPAPADRIPGLQGRRILITAGPTREPIDPVRYISNHSSGKQGYALAAAARAAGALVTLVSGPVALPEPAGVTTIQVTSARDMHDAVMARIADCEVFIGVAAVADFRPVTAAGQKLKKTPGGSNSMTLELVENPDIIAAVAAHPQRPFVAGFAAETENTLAHARDKLVRKGLDLIAVNDVSDPGIGFNSDDNAVTLIWEGGEQRLPRSSKADVAAALLRMAADRLTTL